MASSQALGFPFDSEEEFELILGDSFLSNRPNTGFHTVRYDFKPASVDTSQPGNLEVGAGGEVTVSLPNIQESGTTVYRGSKKPCPKECILVVDKEKRTITLERLTSTVHLKKIRSAHTTNTTAKSSQSSSNTVHQNEPVISSEDTKTQMKSNSSMSVAIDSPTSNSSSSDSDSDLEDVDEEVAKLNATLIGPATEQEKVVNLKGESSSSYNQICKDLELSESGSDSD